eukprot:87543_1
MSTLLSLKVSHQTARDALFLTIGAVSPFILRSVADWTISFVLERCCSMTKKELATHIIGKGNSSVSIVNIWAGSINWTKAKERLGVNTCAAVTISIIRLLFWHWMQPILYVYVLYAYWDLLVETQQVLGLIVGVREVIYFLLTIIAACANPVFLIVDLRASSLSLVGCYVIAPEKYVFMALFNNLPDKYVFITKHGVVFGICVLVLMDFAGAISFVHALAIKNAYVPLMIGYGVTAIGGFFVVCFIMWFDCCLK